MAENTPTPLGRRSKRTRQDSNDADYNPAVPGTSTANIYRDLAVLFINDPRSKITTMHMESSAGYSRVKIELEVPNGA
jgi:hypothetical protein